MANITVVSTTNAIKVDFGAYAGNPLQMSKGTWRKDKITSIQFDSSGNFTHVNVVGEVEWFLSYGGTAGTYTVDSVDTVAPTSESDLYDKLIALIT